MGHKIVLFFFKILLRLIHVIAYIMQFVFFAGLDFAVYFSYELKRYVCTQHRVKTVTE